MIEYCCKYISLLLLPLHCVCLGLVSGPGFLLIMMDSKGSDQRLAEAQGRHWHTLPIDIYHILCGCLKHSDMKMTFAVARLHSMMLRD